jgi:hypothetical protein
MLTRRAAIPALAVLTAGAGSALAHHGWGGFDRNAVLELSGPVVRSTYANPHGIVVLVREGQELTFELAPVSRMQARGLSEADIARGQTVKLHGYRNVGVPTLYRAEWIEAGGKRVELR